MTYAPNTNPVINRDALVHIIAEAERWLDQVEPYREDMSETKKAWRLGFAAAMQRIEIYGQQVVEDCK